MTTMALRLIVISVLLACINLAVGGENAGEIHVGGKVMCQDCTKGYHEWANGDRPIKGCKVSLICMDERRRVMYYGSDVTDEKGEFDMTVYKYINGKEVKTQLCSVRLVSSPDPTCNLLTDFGSGKSGVKLRRPITVYRDLVKYTVGPFFFTNPMCDQPDTSSSESDGTYS